MAKKDTKLTKAAHIKRHTEGTSNELSFSVLDAAKNRADAEEGIDSKAQIPRLGGIRLFSWRPYKKNASTPTKDEALALSGSMSESTTSSSRSSGSKNPSSSAAGGVLQGGLASTASNYSSPEDEIKRRKHRRRSHRALIAVITTILLVAAIGGGGYFLYKEITAHQEQVSLLDQSLDKVNEADKVIVALDQIINEDFDESDSETMGKILEAIPDAATLLSEGEELANEALEDMRDSGDKEATEQTIDAIEARKEMLTYGAELLNFRIQAQADIAKIEEIWDMVLSADAAAREAAELVTDTTPENVNASKEKTLEAQTLFNDATYLLSELETSTLSLDTELLYGYLSKRSEAMGYAIASDDAILIQDRVTAETQNEAYNTAETEASTLAKDIPEDITQLVMDAYESAIADTEESYMETRLSASTADAFLRDYLGT